LICQKKILTHFYAIWNWIQKENGLKFYQNVIRFVKFKVMADKHCFELKLKIVHLWLLQLHFKQRIKKFKPSDLHLEFNLIELAANLGWNSAVVRKQLKNLEWTGIKFDDNGNPTSYRKSGLIIELSDLAFRAVVPGDLSDEDHDYLLNYLHNRCAEQERMQLYQLHKVHHAFQSVSSSNILEAVDSFNKMKSDSLRNFVFEYFNQSNANAPSNWKIESASISADKEQSIRQDINNLLLSYRDTIFTGRAVAKIFQGIESPCYPAQDWNRNKQFWRKHLDVDFKVLLRISGEEVIKKLK